MMGVKVVLMLSNSLIKLNYVKEKQNFPLTIEVCDTIRSYAIGRLDSELDFLLMKATCGNLDRFNENGISSLYIS